MTTTVEPSRLREPERRALESLQATGIARIPFEDLVGDAALWDDLASQVNAFVEEVQDRAPRDVDRPMGKDDYLIRWRPWRRRTRGCASARATPC